MKKILIIDDDTELCDLLSEYLTEAGFSCSQAAKADIGIKMAVEGGWALIILDVMLPEGSGLEVLQRLRTEQLTNALPVLMLSAKGEEVDRVVGLEMGADDYLSKPFSARELMARIRALLRRTDYQPEPNNSQQPACIGDLQIWSSSLQIAIQGNSKIEVSATELRLLEILIEKPGTIISREQLYREAMGQQRPQPFDRRLDMLVSRLRKKLGLRKDGGERIRAIRGEGYVYLISEDQVCS